MPHFKGFASKCLLCIIKAVTPHLAAGKTPSEGIKLHGNKVKSKHSSFLHSSLHQVLTLARHRILHKLTWLNLGKVQFSVRLHCQEPGEELFQMCMLLQTRWAFSSYLRSHPPRGHFCTLSQLKKQSSFLIDLTQKQIFPVQKGSLFF